MRKVVTILVTAFAIAFAADARINYWLSQKGALAKVKIKVIDQDGVAVPRAKIWGCFTTGDGFDDYALVDAFTDTNGEYVAQNKCNERLRLDVTKEGYYRTDVKIYFARSKADPLVVDGKWQPYGETRTVVLKKIKNPYAVKVFAGEQCHRKIPVFEQWLPFDMGVSDWLAPYGKGKYSDVLLRFERKIVERGGFAFSMEACFTNNPYAGVYCKTLDESSDLKTDYHADTNANYCANYRFLYDVINKGPAKKMGCERNSYLVFRTRTRVDENGKLIGAHYGKYCRGWSSDAREMQFGSSCFNPVENDNNIEGDQMLHYAIRNYKNKK